MFCFVCSPGEDQCAASRHLSFDMRLERLGGINVNADFTNFMCFKKVMKYRLFLLKKIKS